MKKHSTKPKRLSTVPVIKSTMKALIEDFKHRLTQQEYEALVGFLATNDIVQLREACDRLVDYNEADPARFKARYQLALFFKKYTFPKDVFSSAEVDRLSIEKFMDNQRRIDSLTYEGLSNETAKVLQWAKGWIATCLGYYDETEHLKACRWAKKSSVGVPMARASIAARYEIPITGSHQHLEWFSHTWLTWHNRPLRYIERQRTEEKNLLYAEVDALGAVLVPKTFKSRRMIVPNTTIGGLYSSGLGRVIENRLRLMGYDIRVLQQKHRELARIASVDGRLTTADQSLASDNITCALTKMTFPLRWYNQIMKGRIGKLVIDGAQVETKTLSTMGIGFTFPLQTLLFLGLLKGIACVMKEKHATISVFGDDLIYNTSLHDTVVRVFTELGLQINTDKTFSQGYFRESCGGDFFRGLDVRPAIAPELDGGTLLSIRKYEAFIYKLINGLRRRWGDSEIGYALSYLGSHLESIDVKICVIPPDFPDTGGIKTSSHDQKPWWLESVREPTVDKHGSASFRYLRFIADLRKEDNHDPYYWDRLLGCIDGFDADSRQEDPHWTVRILDNQGYFISCEAEVQPKAYRSKLTGRRLRKTETHIATSVGRYRVQTGSSCCWTHATPYQVDEGYETEWMC